jgi:hypothetical protein
MGFYPAFEICQVKEDRKSLRGYDIVPMLKDALAAWESDQHHTSFTRRLQFIQKGRQ